MTKPAVPEDEFIRLFNAEGPAVIHKRFGVSLANIHRRRRVLAGKGVFLESPIGPGGVSRAPGRGHHRIEWTIPNGRVIVGSDSHTWPGKQTTAMRAFIKFAADRENKGVILNGDIFDGANISRHAQIMWEKAPGVAKELEAAQDWLNELVGATPRGVKMAWPQGNHDARFESKLSAGSPEYAGIKGVHLKDHFSNRLEPCWAVWVNDDVVVKHRGKGGIHATHNNAVASGKSFVTGHLHSAKVTPWSDYNGTRWGVDCGCLADPYGPQFLGYTEDGPRNHRAGFAVLTFRDGKLLQPELVLVWDENHVQFRGQLLKV